jgi:uncharacterized protein YjiS (DUF1127 family)
MAAIHFESHPRAQVIGLARRQARTRRHNDALDALADAADWVRTGLREWRRRLRDRATLAQFDDHALRDIGLTRCEAEYLINKPFWRK